MIKKTLFLLLFSLFFTNASQAEAACAPRAIPQNCPVGQINACTYGGNYYCCDVPNECIPKCSNGMIEGQVTCETPLLAVICSPGETPEMRPLQECRNNARCQEGIGCVLILSPTPTSLPPFQSPTPAQPPFASPLPTPLPDGGTGFGDLAPDSFLHSVNPLAVGVTQGSPNFLNFLAGIFNIVRFRTPGQVLSALFPWLFTFAGLILFVMLMWGGFEMLSGAATPNSQEAGKNRIQAAVIGFFLLFITYWIAQIIQTIFGVNILGN